MRRPSPSFALVDLVITMVLITTLAGLAALYYSEAQEERIKGVVKNELDELVKAAQTRELERHRQITIEDVEDSMRRHGRLLTGDRKTGTLDLLVDAGKLAETPVDPWGEDYRIDPSQGIIFSCGKDRVARTSDDWIRTYRKEIGQGTIQQKDLRACKTPPVIATFDPCDTVVKDSRPIIRASYYAGTGCAIDLAKTQLFLNQVPVQGAFKSGGQLTYQPTTPLSDGRYNLVLVVKDTAGNETRRQCTFLVDTHPPDVRITNPPSGKVLCAQFSIEGLVLDKSLRDWSLNWDYRQVARGEAEVGSKEIDGRLVPGTLFKDFSTIDPANPVEDGRHFITLFERNLSGQTVTAQSEVVVDNTPPKVIISRNHPGAKGDPPIITTDIVRFFGLATDNIMVRSARFKFFDRLTGHLVPESPTEGTTAVPIKWNPLDYTTQRNWGALFNAPIVEWGTVPSRGTTEQWHQAGFREVQLPPSEYRMEVTAYDLCGNASTPAVTNFNIRLQKMIISEPALLDLATLVSKRVPPYYEEDKHISGLTTLAPEDQTKGAVKFFVTEAGSTPIATWEVVIDDNGGNDTFSGDSQYVTSGPVRDWAASGPLPTTTEEPIITKFYVPDGVNEYEPSTNNYARRRGGVRSGRLAEGIYCARIRFTSDAGLTRTTYTTFLVDNSLPQVPPSGTADDKIVKYLGRSYSPPHRDLDDTKGDYVPISAGPIKTVLKNCWPEGPVQATGNLEFAGKTRDYPTTGVITRVSWALTQQAPGAALRTIKNGEVFTLGPSTRRTNIVTYGVIQGQPTMYISTSNTGGLDGDGYHIAITAVDGAGLTTTVVRPFRINTLGPVVRAFTFLDERAPTSIQSISGDVPTTHVIEDQGARVSFRVADEGPLTRILYRIYRLSPQVDSTAVMGVVTAAVLMPEQTVWDTPSSGIRFTRDSLGKPFASLPTVYAFEVDAMNADGVDGPQPVFTTLFGLRFVSNLAIFAPFYHPGSGLEATYRTIASTNSSWVGVDEQVAITDFLMNPETLTKVKTRAVYGYTGGLRQASSAVAPSTIASWVAEQTSNRTTDVLVVLDGFSQSIWDNSVADPPALRFAESASFDPARAGNSRDGDAIVWVGEVPFAWKFASDGRRLPYDGSTDKTRGPARFYRLGSNPSFYDLSPDPGTGSPGQDSHRQDLAPLGAASAFLADLYPYDPFSDFEGLPGGGLPIERQLKSAAMTLGIQRSGGERWVLDHLFSVNRASLGDLAAGNRAVSGSNFQFRNLDSQGLVAHFMCMGPRSGTDAAAYPSVVAGERRKIPAVAQIIVDYIEKHVLHRASPQDGSRRIYFEGPSTTRLGGTGLGGRDIAFWPDRVEAFGNVTRVTGGGQSATLQAASAGQSALYTARNQAQIDQTWNFGAASLFLFDHGSVQLVEAVNVADITQASISGNGLAAAFATATDLSRGPGNQVVLPNPVIFYKQVGGVSSQITTSAAAAGNPRVSSAGDFVVFDAQSTYDTVTFPPSFVNSRTTGGRSRIYRFSTRSIAQNAYADGVVTGSTLDNDRLPENADSTLPVGSRDGACVVFQTRGAFLPNAGVPNARTQIALAALTMVPTPTWFIGAITADTAGDSTAPDITPDPIRSNFPFVVFESVVPYDNAYPSQSAPGNDLSGADLPVKAEGARATGTPNPESFRSIFLFPGSYGSRILRIAKGDNADCRRPRISPDGEDVVFESTARKVTGFLSSDGTNVTAQTIDNGTGGIDRVYRVRIRPFQVGGTSPYYNATFRSMIIQRISPVDLDLGTASPQASN